MKRYLTGLLCGLLLLSCTACTAPDDLKLDLYQGYHRELHLLHWNANSDENAERIETFAKMFEGAVALEKDISLFAYYPDYRLVVRGKSLSYEVGEDGTLQNIQVNDDENGIITAVVDLNGDYVDFYLPDSETPDTIYRSPFTTTMLTLLVHST